MNNSVKDFIFGDGNTMNNLFRQFSMGAVAMAVMLPPKSALPTSYSMQTGQGTEIRVMFNGLPPQPAVHQLGSSLPLDFRL